MSEQVAPPQQEMDDAPKMPKGEGPGGATALPVEGTLQTAVVPAGSTFTKTVEVEGRDHSFGTRISWFFKEKFDFDVDFSVTQGEVPVKTSSRCITNKGSYATKPGEKCTVQLQWNNSFSWMKSKSIDYALSILEPEDAEAAARAEEERVAAIRAEDERRRVEAERLRMEEEARIAEEERKKEVERRERELKEALQKEIASFGSIISEEAKSWENMRCRLAEEKEETLKNVAMKFKEIEDRTEADIVEGSRKQSKAILAFRDHVTKVVSDPDSLLSVLDSIEATLTKVQSKDTKVADDLTPAVDVVAGN